MEISKLKAICLEACGSIRHAGAFIKDQLGKVEENQIISKDLNSLVSYVDKETEKQLVAALALILPEAGFLTEEETVEQESKRYRWIIDPLDGTTNFLHQIPFFSISVALEVDEELVLGIVYEVNRDECFYAWKGGGCWLNNKQVHVRPEVNFSHSIIATGFPYYDFTNTDPYLAVLKECITNTRGVRRLGSAALDLAYTACGRFDAFYEITLNAWDVAAGIVLVKEAGGQISDFRGGQNFLYGQEIIAGSPQIFEALSAIIEEKYIAISNLEAEN